jgi:hypothetical protein
MAMLSLMRRLRSRENVETGLSTRPETKEVKQLPKISQFTGLKENKYKNVIASKSF